MKKFTSIFAILVFITFFASKTSAQNFSLGGALVYGTNISTVGISVNGDYAFDSKLSIAPSFIYFFSSDPVSWTVINVDGHYKFMSKNDLSVYGIAGINITFATVSYDFGELGGNFSETASNFGVNLGVGASKKIAKKIDLFGDLRYTIANGSYLTISAGAMYYFN